MLLTIHNVCHNRTTNQTLIFFPNDSFQIGPPVRSPPDLWLPFRRAFPLPVPQGGEGGAAEEGGIEEGAPNVKVKKS